MTKLSFQQKCSVTGTMGIVLLLAILGIGLFLFAYSILKVYNFQMYFIGVLLFVKLYKHRRKK